MLKPIVAALTATALLAGCASFGGTTLRYPVPAVTPSEKVNIRFHSIEVRQVSLPEYAELSEMSNQTADGAIETQSKLLWADNPVRSVTLELARNLGLITGATVASEPWPFETFADARLEVRVEEMLTDQANQFRLSGQYFVAGSSGNVNRSRLFNLAVPIAGEPGPASMAAARGQIISDLALMIAKDGLR